MNILLLILLAVVLVTINKYYMTLKALTSDIQALRKSVNQLQLDNGELNKKLFFAEKTIELKDSDLQSKQSTIELLMSKLKGDSVG